MIKRLHKLLWIIFLSFFNNWKVFSLIQAKIKVRKLIIFFGQETFFWLKSLILQTLVTRYIKWLPGNSLKRLFTFLKRTYLQNKRPGPHSRGEQHSVNSWLWDSLRNCPKTPNHKTCASYSKARGTEVMRIAWRQQLPVFQHKAGKLGATEHAAGLQGDCRTWPFRAGYLNYCPYNVTLHWNCLRNACSSRAGTEHLSPPKFYFFIFFKLLLISYLNDQYFLDFV